VQEMRRSACLAKKVCVSALVAASFIRAKKAVNALLSGGAINGGFYEKTGDFSQVTTIVIAVDGLKASMQKIIAAGGKISGDPMDMPGIGQYASFFDTEGNRVGMLQPLPRK